MAQSGATSLANQSRIAVCYDRENATYTAGDVINGYVELDLKQEVRVKGIRLHFYGSARVTWDEQQANFKGGSWVVSMKNNEVFIDHIVQLLSKDKDAAESDPRKRPPRRSTGVLSIAAGDDDGMQITVGVHKLPFSYTLPPAIPSSYDGKWGQIQYSVKVILERAWKGDIEKMTPFIVRARVDFSEDLDVVRPIAGSSEFNASGFCCGNGPVNVDIRVGRKGFILGEQIPFYVEITNGSSRTMRNSKVALVQHTIFRAGNKLGNKMRKVTSVIQSISKGVIPPGQTRLWEDEELVIPENISPTCLKECKAIQIKYTLTISIIPSGFIDDFVIPVNIMIGTVPIRKATIQRFLQQVAMATGEPSLTNGRLSAPNLLNVPSEQFMRISRRASIVDSAEGNAHVASGRRLKSNPAKEPQSPTRLEIPILTVTSHDSPEQRHKRERSKPLAEQTLKEESTEGATKKKSPTKSKQTKGKGKLQKKGSASSESKTTKSRPGSEETKQSDSASQRKADTKVSAKQTRRTNKENTSGVEKKPKSADKQKSSINSGTTDQNPSTEGLWPRTMTVAEARRRSSGPLPVE